MRMTIDDKIDHLQTLMNVWEVELRHSSNTTEKEINQGIVDSLNSAIDTMRKYQKIQEIINNAKDSDGAIRFNWLYEQIKEVIEDGTDR